MTSDLGILGNDGPPPPEKRAFLADCVHLCTDANLKVQISPPDRWLLPVMRTLVALLPFTGMEQCIEPAKPSQTI